MQIGFFGETGRWDKGHQDKTRAFMNSILWRPFDSAPREPDAPRPAHNAHRMIIAITPKTSTKAEAGRLKRYVWFENDNYMYLPVVWVHLTKRWMRHTIAVHTTVWQLRKTIRFSRLVNAIIRSFADEVRHLEFDMLYNISFLAFRNTRVQLREVDDVPVNARLDFLRDDSVIAPELPKFIREVHHFHVSFYFPFSCEPYIDSSCYCWPSLRDSYLWMRTGMESNTHFDHVSDILPLPPQVLAPATPIGGGTVGGNTRAPLAGLAGLTNKTWAISADVQRIYKANHKKNSIKIDKHTMQHSARLDRMCGAVSNAYDVVLPGEVRTEHTLQFHEVMARKG
jgi:hypothetical protein